MDSRRRSWMLVGVAMVVTGTVAVPLGMRGRDAGSRREPVTVAPIAPGSASEAPRSVAVPAVPDDPTEVDRLVRAAAGGLSRHPQLTAWLVTDGLARRIVAAVEAVADGYSPRDELAFAHPTMPLFVRYEGTQAVITDASFRRYDLAAEVVASLDPSGLAEAFQKLKPRLEEVHDRLPYARGNLDRRVLEAIDHLLEVEVPDGPYAVARQTRTWGWADPAIEGLSDAQRHLLRMGPRNARMVQDSLRGLREALGSAPGRDAASGAAEADGVVAAQSAYQVGRVASRSSTP